jgi:hypothetical protein
VTGPYPYRFSHQQASTQRRALPAGDYGVEAGGEIVAVVERKTLADLAGRLVDGSLTYALAELATLERAALVVEDRYADLFKLQHVAAGFVADLLAAVQVRYPSSQRVLRHPALGRGMDLPFPRCRPRTPRSRTQQRPRGATMSRLSRAAARPSRRDRSVAQALDNDGHHHQAQ